MDGWSRSRQGRGEHGRMGGSLNFQATLLGKLLKGNATNHFPLHIELSEFLYDFRPTVKPATCFYSLILIDFLSANSFQRLLITRKHVNLSHGLLHGLFL